MNPPAQTRTLDYHLVARVEGCTTGANAHEVHALLGKYFLACDLSGDPECARRFETIEQRLRSFCTSALRQRAVTV